MHWNGPEGNQCWNGGKGWRHVWQNSEAGFVLVANLTCLQSSGGRVVSEPRTSGSGCALSGWSPRVRSNDMGCAVSGPEPVVVSLTISSSSSASEVRSKCWGPLELDAWAAGCLAVSATSSPDEGKEAALAQAELLHLSSKTRKASWRGTDDVCLNA